MTNNINEVDPKAPGKKNLIDPAEDGRNIEWEDRARVNLEQVPEDVSTNIERDFEPEDLGGENKKDSEEIPPN